MTMKDLDVKHTVIPAQPGFFATYYNEMEFAADASLAERIEHVRNGLTAVVAWRVEVIGEESFAFPVCIGGALGSGDIVVIEPSGRVEHVECATFDTLEAFVEYQVDAEKRMRESHKTFSPVRAALVRYTDVHGIPAGAALLTKYKAANISTLVEDKHAAFIAECEAGVEKTA
jgi:hypothetical protein